MKGFKFPDKFYWAIPIALIWLFYGFSLGDPLYFDSRYMLTESLMDEWYSVFSWPRFFLNSREFGRLFFWWNIKVFGLDPVAFRVINVGIHTLISVLVYFVCLEFLTKEKIKSVFPKSWGAKEYALAASLWFAVHPAGIFAVQYVIQRYLLLATLFFLVGFYSYIQSYYSGNKIGLFVSVLCLFLATRFKEQALVLPLVLSLFSWVYREQRKITRNEMLGAIGLMLLIVVQVVSGHLGVLGSTYEPYAGLARNTMSISDATFNQPMTLEGTRLFLQSVHNQGYLFFRYLITWVIPNAGWMNLDAPQPFPLSLFVWPQTLGFFAFLVFVFGSIWALQKKIESRNLVFALACFWIAFLPELSVTRFHENYVIYRSYLWATLLMIALPYLWNRIAGWIGNRVVLGYLSLVLILMMVIGFHDRLNLFSDRVALWRSAVNELNIKDHLVPSAYRTIGNLAAAYGERGQFQEAYDTYKVAAKINPEYDKAWFGMAMSKRFLNLQKDSEIYYKRAIAVNPLYKEAYYWLGKTYRDLKQPDKAMHNFELAVHLDSGTLEAESLIEFAQVALQLEDYEKAKKAYIQLVSKFPTDRDFLNNYGVVLNHLGEYDKAIPVFKKLIKVEPEYSKGYFNLGNAFMGIEDFVKSEEEYSRTVKLNPNDALAWNNLGLSLLKQGKLDQSMNAYQKALDIKPKYQPSIRGLDIVKKLKTTAQSTQKPE